MDSNDLEKQLKDAALLHLTDDELDSYLDNDLDQVRVRLAEAHLKLCHLCKSRVAFFKEENAAIENNDITAEDVDLVRQLIARKGPLRNKPGKPVSPALLEQLAGYLKQMMVSWQLRFSQVQSLGSEQHSESVWQWQNKDKTIKAEAVMRDDATLTIEISATNMELEGIPLSFRLGPFTRQIILLRKSDSLIVAAIEVPKEQRAETLSDLSITIVE